LRNLRPFFNILIGIFFGTKTCTQFLDKFVIEETQIGGVELRVQNARLNKESERGAFGAIGWQDKDFTIALKECAGDVTVYGRDHADDAVGKDDMQVFAINGDMANVMYVGSGEGRLKDLAIEGEGVSLGKGGLGQEKNN
jgi:hypothetical protein